MRKIYDHDAILADYLAGLSVTQIAAKYGCPGNLGCILAKRRGLSRSPEVVNRANKMRGQRVRESHATSPQRIKRLLKFKRLADHAKRHGIAAAAAKFGYTESRAREIAKLHGWVRLPHRFDQAEIMQDYLAGMKLREIAKKHGCNLTYPSQLAKSAGKLRYRVGSAVLTYSTAQGTASFAA